MYKDEIVYTVEKWEGGAITDVPEDKGGLTKFGITHAAYPRLDIENLSFEEAYQLYLRDYWEPLKLDQLKSIRLRWKVFDIAVNMGKVTSAMALQKATGATVDGEVGSDTLGRANSMEENELIAKLVELQAERYVRIVLRDASQIRFLLGWMRRATDQGHYLTRNKQETI